MRDYTKIGAWKLADDLTVALYERARTFPREESYGLTSQLRRAAYPFQRMLQKAPAAAASAIICIFFAMRVARWQRHSILFT